VMLDGPSHSRRFVSRAHLGFARFALVAADLCALALANLAAHALLPAFDARTTGGAGLLPLSIMIILYAHAKLPYLQGQPDDVMSRRQSILAPALTVGFSIAIALSLNSAVHLIIRSYDPARVSVAFAAVWALSAGMTAAFFRLVGWFALVNLRGIKSLQTRVAIVGAGPIGTQLVQVINQHFTGHLRIVGIYDERMTRVPEEVEGFRVDSMAALVETARQNGIDKILVALPLSAEERLLALLQRLKTLPIDVALIPDNLGLRLMGNSDLSKQGLDRVLLNILHRPLSAEDLALKRAFDIFASAALLLLFAPIMLVIALAIIATSPGPVFFRQPRAGLYDNIIHVLKFRTMYVNQTDLHARQQTRRNDPRITKIGHFLRKTSIDELPQLINVLRGEMSLVGPRPHATGMQIDGRLCHEILREYAQRHRVKPGITGWAQVCGLRGAVDDPAVLTERIERDIYYIDNWSLWFDIKILLLTLPEMIRSRNAF